MSIKKKTANSYSLKKSDVDFYRMCIVFAFTCAFILLIMKMSSTRLERHATGLNLTYNFYTLCHNPVFLAVSAIAAIAGIAWFIYNRVKKADEGMRIVTSYDILSLVIYVAAFYAAFGFILNSSLHMFFIALTLIVCALYFIAKIYKPDFLFYSASNAVFALSLYLIAYRAEPAIIAFKIAFIVLWAIFAALIIKKNSTRVKSAKKNGRAPLNFPVFISLALWAVFMFWRVLPLTGSVFLTINAMLVVLFVQYIVFAIIYTIRLIRE